MDEKNSTNSSKQPPEPNSNQEDRPRKGLEDWEMLQPREEPPLRIPYWFIALVCMLLIGAVILTFPLTGVRSGFERPWLDWGLVVGVGYGLACLTAIFFFLKFKSRPDAKTDTKDSKK